MTDAFLSHSSTRFVNLPVVLILAPSVAAVVITAVFLVLSVGLLCPVLTPINVSVVAVLSLGFIWWLSVIAHFVHALTFVPVHASYFANRPKIIGPGAVLRRCLWRQLGTMALAAIVVPILSLCRWHARVMHKTSFLTGAFYEHWLRVLDVRLGHLNKLSLYGALLSDQDLANGGRYSAAVVDRCCFARKATNIYIPDAVVLLSAVSSSVVSIAVAVSTALVVLDRTAAVAAIPFLIWASAILGAVITAIPMVALASCSWSLLLCWTSNPSRMSTLAPEFDDALTELAAQDGADVAQAS